jgi:hypothetical protein
VKGKALLVSLATLAALLAAVPLAARADSKALTGPVLILTEPIPVATGSGSQTSPHVSGSVASYTDRQSGANVNIKYVDLAAPGPGTQVPQEPGYVDQLSDVSNGVIVFQRVNLSTGAKAIYFYNTNTAAAPVALSPDPTAVRSNAAIGGTTVAYEQQADATSSLHTDICISSILTPTAPASW